MQVPASVFNPLMLLIEGSVIGFIIAVPVGPAAALCIRRSITVGAVAGYLTGVGAAAGDAVFGAVAAFGLSFVIEFVARNEAWLRGIGGIVLVVMGASTMRHRTRAVGDPVADDAEHWISTHFHYATSSFFITVFNPLTVMAFAAAFAVKSPIWPFHTWSPLTYAEAPTGAAIVFSALLAKMGGYGLLRYAVGLLPGALPHVRGVVSVLAIIGILYGSMVACATPDLKRLLAYSSLAQMGFVTLGVMSTSLIATEGAVLLMFNHGVIALGLFLLVGFIEKRRGSYAIADLSGLQGPAPVMAALFTLVMLASIGLPGLSGFVSEFLVLLGTYNVHPWFALTAALGVIAAAAYLLWAYQRVFHGEATGANAQLADLTTRERLTMAPVAALVVFIGVYPKPFLQMIEPAVRALLIHVDPTGLPR